METVVLYHAHCKDGFTAAWAAWKSLGSQARYIAYSHGDALLADDLAWRRLYVLDLSLPKYVMEELFETAAEVVWLDHHKSSFDAYLGEDYLTPARQRFTGEAGPHQVELDNEVSGAMLAWRHFHRGVPAPALVRYVQDRDLWRFEFGDATHAVNAVLGLKPMSFEAWDSVDAWLGTDETGLIETGTALVGQHSKLTEDAVDASVMPLSIGLEDDEVLTGLVANLPKSMASEGGHLLCASTGLGASYHIDRQNRAVFSLRSDGRVDCARIARKFGGGGHANAAGFSVPVTDLIVPVSNELVILQPGLQTRVQVAEEGQEVGVHG